MTWNKCNFLGISLATEGVSSSPFHTYLDTVDPLGIKSLGCRDKLRVSP